MELSLLCGVKVMLCVVDKSGRDVLYVSENSNPESLVKKNVVKNIKNKTYVSNQNVMLFNISMMISLLKRRRSLLIIQILEEVQLVFQKAR